MMQSQRFIVTPQDIFDINKLGYIGETLDRTEAESKKFNLLEEENLIGLIQPLEQLVQPLPSNMQYNQIPPQNIAKLVQCLKSALRIVQRHRNCQSSTWDILKRFTLNTALLTRILYAQQLALTVPGVLNLISVFFPSKQDKFFSNSNESFFLANTLPLPPSLRPLIKSFLPEDLISQEVTLIALDYLNTLSFFQYMGQVLTDLASRKVFQTQPDLGLILNLLKPLATASRFFTPQEIQKLGDFFPVISTLLYQTQIENVPSPIVLKCIPKIFLLLEEYSHKSKRHSIISTSMHVEQLLFDISLRLIYHVDPQVQKIGVDQLKSFTKYLSNNAPQQMPEQQMREEQPPGFFNIPVSVTPKDLLDTSDATINRIATYTRIQRLPRDNVINSCFTGGDDQSSRQGPIALTPQLFTYLLLRIHPALGDQMYQTMQNVNPNVPLTAQANSSISLLFNNYTIANTFSQLIRSFMKPDQAQIVVPAQPIQLPQGTNNNNSVNTLFDFITVLLSACTYVQIDQNRFTKIKPFATFLLKFPQYLVSANVLPQYYTFLRCLPAIQFQELVYNIVEEFQPYIFTGGQTQANPLIEPIHIPYFKILFVVAGEKKQQGAAQVITKILYDLTATGRGEQLQYVAVSAEIQNNPRTRQQLQNILSDGGLQADKVWGWFWSLISQQLSTTQSPSQYLRLLESKIEEWDAMVRIQRGPQSLNQNPSLSQLSTLPLPAPPPQPINQIQVNLTSTQQQQRMPPPVPGQRQPTIIPTPTQQAPNTLLNQSSTTLIRAAAESPSGIAISLRSSRPTQRPVQPSVQGPTPIAPPNVPKQTIRPTPDPKQTSSSTFTTTSITTTANITTASKTDIIQQPVQQHKPVIVHHLDKDESIKVTYNVFDDTENEEEEEIEKNAGLNAEGRKQRHKQLSALRSDEFTKQLKIFVGKQVDKFKTKRPNETQEAVEKRSKNLHIVVERNDIMRSTYQAIMSGTMGQFKDKNDKFVMYLPLYVEFLHEKGLDYGGVRRDFFATLFQEIVKKEEGMFESNEQNDFRCSLAPPTLFTGPMAMRYFRFVGIMLAEAVLSQVTIPVRFDFFILKTILGLQPSLSDLSYVSPDEYKIYKDILEQDVTYYCLTFSITETDATGNSQDVDLIDGQGDMEVTNDNKREYVQLIVNKKLLAPTITQRLYSLRDGFHSLIPPIQMTTDLTIKAPSLPGQSGSTQQVKCRLRPEDLDILISGQSIINVDDWEKNTVITDDLKRSKEGKLVVKWFWEIVRSVTEEQRHQILFFATGSYNPPALGFGKMAWGNQNEPRPFKLDILEEDENHHPHAHTCFNRIDLPLYKTKQKMQDKLMVAVDQSSGGFTEA